MLEQKQIPPPYRPRLENERDLANFPPEVPDPFLTPVIIISSFCPNHNPAQSKLQSYPYQFTDEPVQLTPDDPGIIGKIDQTEFEGFE